MLIRSPLRGATVRLLILLAVATRSVLAVDPNRPTTSYTRTSFTVEDGLSSNVVNAIVQTRSGFLWIGTDAGLDRFNGRHFTPIYFRGPRTTPTISLASEWRGCQIDSACVNWSHCGRTSINSGLLALVT